MKRREFMTLLGGAAAAWPLAARAQQTAMPVVGFVHPASPDPLRRQVAAFWRALNEAGYVEGQNLAIEYRWAEDHYDRIPGLVADLVRRQVAVIVAGGGTVQAVKAVGTSIPTIFTTGADPVREGLVPSLSRPGGSMTGAAFFVTAMGPKQLEMLLAAVPSAKLIGLVSDPAYPYRDDQLGQLETAVRALGRKLIVAEHSERGRDRNGLHRVRPTRGRCSHCRWPTFFLSPSRADGHPGRPPCAAHLLWLARVRHGRRPDELWCRPDGGLSSGRCLHCSRP
jgi:putative ABC transport system substrate-binding protein